MPVWLVISSFQNDKEIIKILEQVHAAGEQIFGRILVVDSLGTGVIPDTIKKRKWERVIYRSYDENLGSGANLRERLRLAAEGGADYAYALNHDGKFDANGVNALLKAATSIQNLGAAYPLSFLADARGYNLTGTRELPLPAKLVPRAPKGPPLDVFWSSSNGALYSTAPAKQGILPWEAMWMGWEDLEYGWRLHDHGYRQVIVCDAVFDDNYEYISTPIGFAIRKPAWRTYYMMRNLILAIRRNRNRTLYHATAVLRFFLEGGLIICFRDRKWQRIKMLCSGAVDGIKGVEERRDSLDYSNA
jgi:GT2 family glycosyltransferase